MPDPWQDPNPYGDFDPAPPVDVNELEDGNPLKKVRFQFRHQDEYILERIQTEADEMFAEMFTEAIEQMNTFYSCLRVPHQINGQVQKDLTTGEILWEKENGEYVENWDQLTGQDLEQIYMNLEKIKIFLTPVVNKLKLEAMWAKISAGDAKDDVRLAISPNEKILESDKAARANRDSREDRYLEFFKYYLYSSAQVFYDQIVDFQWKLCNIRNWRIQSQA